MECGEKSNYLLQRKYFSNFNPAPISSIKYPKIPINVQTIISSLQENSLQYSTDLAATYSTKHETYHENADISLSMTCTLWKTEQNMCTKKRVCIRFKIWDRVFTGILHPKARHCHYLNSVCEKKGLNYIMNSMSHRIDYGKRGDCHRT